MCYATSSKLTLQWWRTLTQWPSWKPGEPGRGDVGSSPSLYLNTGVLVCWSASSSFLRVLLLDRSSRPRRPDPKVLSIHPSDELSMTPRLRGSGTIKATVSFPCPMHRKHYSARAAVVSGKAERGWVATCCSYLGVEIDIPTGRAVVGACSQAVCRVISLPPLAMLHKTAPYTLESFVNHAISIFNFDVDSTADCEALHGTLVSMCLSNMKATSGGIFNGSPRTGIFSPCGLCLR